MLQMALKDFPVESIKNGTEKNAQKFGDIDDDKVQNAMFNNVAATINSVKNNESYQKLNEYMSKIDQMYNKVIPSNVKTA